MSFHPSALLPLSSLHPSIPPSLHPFIPPPPVPPSSSLIWIGSLLLPLFLSSYFVHLFLSTLPPSLPLTSFCQAALSPSLSSPFFLSPFFLYILKLSCKLIFCVGHMLSYPLPFLSLCFPLVTFAPLDSSTSYMSCITYMTSFICIKSRKQK